MTQTTQKTKLLRIECDPACGFILQSHDETELVEYARDHAFRFHNSDVTAATARTWAKSA